jgi:O-antigen/teichoic acid export membrane protein
MSRLKKFQRNLFATYSQVGAMAVYALVSVPLILHWLPTEEFGLWAVLVQIMGYVSLIDLGMTAATCRLLVDYKDNPADGRYGSLLKTLWLVCLVQSLLVMMAFMALAPLLAVLLEIPDQYAGTFILLMRCQSLVTGIGFLIRPLNVTLVAHQRVDITVYSEIFFLGSSLVLLSLLLANGVGIFSYFYAGLVSPLLNPLWLFWNCRRLGLLPKSGQWGRASRQMFGEIFNYGKDLFLVTLGWQLIVSSQTIVISRFLGLEAAGIWAVGSKVFNFVMQLVQRTFYMSMPTLAEMLARRETERLKKRFKELALLVDSLAVTLAVGFSLCNSLFISVWTSGKIFWPPLNDVLLAVWLVVVAVQTSHMNLVILRKEIGKMSYVLLAEGVAFVTLAWLMSSRWGIAGILAASIICTLLFSCQYCLRRGRRDFGCDSLWEVAVDWLAPAFKLALTLGLTAVACWWATLTVNNLWLRLAINAAVSALVGGGLFVHIGCPASVVHETGKFLPVVLRKWLLALLPENTR